MQLFLELDSSGKNVHTQHVMPKVFSELGLTWRQSVVALLHHDRAMICHEICCSHCRHAQAPVSTDGESALPFWQISLEVAFELIGGLVIDALPLQGALLPNAPQATPLGVPVHPLHNEYKNLPNLVNSVVLMY